MSIATSLELRKFLSSKDIPCYELEPLPGGAGISRWRSKTLLGRRSIVKHAEPPAHSEHDPASAVSNIQREYLALYHVPQMILDDGKVHISEVYHYFEREGVIDMFDGGPINLVDAYIANNALDITAVGARIGSWLARLHVTTSQPKTSGIVATQFDNGPSAALVTLYQNLESTFEKLGCNGKLGRSIDQKFVVRIAVAKKCLCHGNLSPSKFLLDDAKPSAKIEELDGDEEVPMLTLDEWASVRFGNGAVDVGQFAAEAWYLDTLHGNRGLLGAFLESYAAEGVLNDDDKLDIAVHFSVYMLTQAPTEAWANARQGTKPVQIAEAILMSAYEGHLQELTSGPLGRLFCIKNVS